MIWRTKEKRKVSKFERTVLLHLLCFMEWVSVRDLQKKECKIRQSVLQFVRRFLYRSSEVNSLSIRLSGCFVFLALPLSFKSNCMIDNRFLLQNQSCIHEIF